MRKLLKKGNLKLSSKQGIWTLPRSTCIGAGNCRKFCYGKKFANLPNVKESREWKLKKAKSKNFIKEMVEEIERRKLKIIRIHEVGDFFNQEYLDKWKEIAKQLSNVIFYAFTKSFELDLWSNLPDNFIILQSYGSKYDQKINKSKNTARVVDSIDEVKKGEYLCPYYLKHSGGFTKCGDCCSYCFSNYPKVKHIVFLKH